jgi:ABC-type nitrate/sulfonate/bicarbonate transport system permease component
MFVGIITMALTGYLLDRLIRGLESLLIPWKED